MDTLAEVRDAGPGAPWGCRDSLWAYGLILACAWLVTLPLWLHGPSCGHDFDFHLQSWFAANAAWHRAGSLQGLWPHWLEAANYGAGEPRFVFYPPLSWTLGGSLGALLPWTLVPQALTFFALAGAGLAFYQLARLWARTPVAAGAACLYLANPYLLFVGYERTAYGELLGAVTLPLIVLYALRPCSRGRRVVVPLALVIATLWLTNAPAAVMGCYLLGLCGVASALAARALAPLGKTLAALVLGTGAASVYVLPAWFEQRWVQIARAVGPGMRVEDSFLFGHSGEAFHDQVLHTASEISVAILGVGLLAVGFQYVLARRVHRAGEGAASVLRGRTPPLSPILATALIAIAFLLLRWSDPVWRYAPELRFLQFPWRWMLVGGLASTLAVAMLAEQVWAACRARFAAAALPVTALALAAGLLCAAAWGAGVYAQRTFSQPCDDEDNVQAQQQLLNPGPSALPGFEGTDEYASAGADNGEVQQGLPMARVLPGPADDEGDDSAAANPPWSHSPAATRGVTVAEWSVEHKQLAIITPRPAYAVLRLMDYPAWLVEVNGRVPGKRPHREDGLLTIPVPAGRTTIEVSYRATLDVYAGRVLSLACLGLLVWLYAGERRHSSRRSGRQSGRQQT